MESSGKKGKLQLLRMYVQEEVEVEITQQVTEQVFAKATSCSWHIHGSESGAATLMLTLGALIGQRSYLI